MSQHVTYRLPDTVVEDLRYLSFLMQTTPARVIALWISTITQAIDAHAGTTVPDRADAAELLRNGGTLLSWEEQQAVRQLQQLIGHWGPSASSPPDRQTETLAFRTTESLSPPAEALTQQGMLVSMTTVSRLLTEPALFDAGEPLAVSVYCRPDLRLSGSRAARDFGRRQKQRRAYGNDSFPALSLAI